jgi:hypothetical protein
MANKPEALTESKPGDRPKTLMIHHLLGERPLTLMQYPSFEEYQMRGNIKPGLGVPHGAIIHAPNVRKPLPVGVEMVIQANQEFLLGGSSESILAKRKERMLQSYLELGYSLDDDPLPTNAMSIFWNTFFKPEYRGKADIFPSFIKMPVIAVTVPLEFLLKNIGAVFLLPLSIIREKESPPQWLYPLAPLGWLISQPFLFLANTLGYARRTVNAVCNLISSATALVGDGWGWVRDKFLKQAPAELDYNNRYPGFATSIKSLIKNGVKLAVNTAIIGVAVFTAGLLPPEITAIVPKAISAAISSASSWVSATLIPSATGWAAAAWAGIGVAAAAASQGLSHGWNKVTDGCALLWDKMAGSTKKLSTVSPALRSVSENEPGSRSFSSPTIVPPGNSRKNSVSSSPSLSPTGDSTRDMQYKLGQSRQAQNDAPSLNPAVDGNSSLSREVKVGGVMNNSAPAPIPERLSSIVSGSSLLGSKRPKETNANEAPNSDIGGVRRPGISGGNTSE